MPAPPVLARVWRGSVPEADIRAHVAIADSTGRVCAALGDPLTVTTLRSAVKPLQAIPFVERAARKVGAGMADLAVACASHQGEDVHVEAVRALLGRAGVSDEALACGPQLPFDEETARRLIQEGEGPQRIRNNCSGKHAAMLATCAVAGWPIEGYRDRDHPCQLAVREALERHLAVDLTGAPWGVDGCGLPTYGVPLLALARAFASAQHDVSFRRCQEAMAAEPYLVAGRGRFDTALLSVAGGRLTAKIGGAAVWAAAVRSRHLGVAVKLEAGVGEAVAPIALAVLVAADAVASPLAEPLQAFALPLLRNWEGTVVGETRVEREPFQELRHALASAL